MKILFVCSGNTCRSPMAEAMFHKMAKEQEMKVECRSVGVLTYTGSPASDNTVEVLKEIGIDITSFRSTDIKSLFSEIDTIDLFVPMTYTHAMILIQYGIEKKKIYLFDHDIPDPYGRDIDVYRKTRDDLAEQLEKLAEFVKKSENI